MIIKRCNIIHSQYLGEIYRVHPLNENCLMYVRSNRTRATLIVSSINIKGVNVQVFDK